MASKPTARSRERARRKALTNVIHETFGPLWPSEIEAIAGFYEKSEMQMFEVTKSDLNAAIVKDLFDDTVYEPVHFPVEIREHLKKQDVFPGTIAYRDSHWSVIHLSPPYD